MDSGEARAKLDELLTAFGAATGVPGLATEDNGVCVLVFDGRTRLYLLVDHTTETLVVWSTTPPCRPTNPSDLRALIQANLFWTGAGRHARADARATMSCWRSAGRSTASMPTACAT